jgi:hypothetical protein
MCFEPVTSCAAPSEKHFIAIFTPVFFFYYFISEFWKKQMFIVEVFIKLREGLEPRRRRPLCKFLA